MKTEHLICEAQIYAKMDENIENGLVNWDFVGADIFLVHRNDPTPLDPEMVEVALATAERDEARCAATGWQFAAEAYKEQI